MHVARSHHRQAQLFAQADDHAVQLPQLLHILHPALADQKGVVAHGLDFQIVIKPCDAGQLFLVRPFQHSAKQLARLASRAYDHAFAVFLNIRARHMRAAAEILEMSVADQMVDVPKALLRGGQQHDMIAAAQGVACHTVVDIGQRDRAALARFLQHLLQTLGRRFSVMHGTVGVFQRYAQALAHHTQLMRFHIGIELAREGQGINHRVFARQTLAVQLALQDIVVKIRVMGGNGTIANKLYQLRQRLGNGRLIAQHLIGNARNFGDFGL